jgi:hypothetical protein
MSSLGRSFETISEILEKSRSRGGRFAENPDFVVDGYPRSANTFLVTALNMSWPNMIVKSHGHDSKNLADANGLVPVVSVIRNPLDAISSYAIHLSLYEPDRINNLALLFGLYGDMAKQATDNQNVFTIPFDEVISDVVGTLDLLEAKYELKNRIYVSPKEILSQTQNVSKQVNLTTDSFTKRGHVPRDKDPLHKEVLKEMQNSIYEKSLNNVTKLYNGLISKYYDEING